MILHQHPRPADNDLDGSEPFKAIDFGMHVIGLHIEVIPGGSRRSNVLYFDPGQGSWLRKSRELGELLDLLGVGEQSGGPKVASWRECFGRCIDDDLAQQYPGA